MKNTEEAKEKKGEPSSFEEDKKYTDIFYDLNIDFDALENKENTIDECLFSSIKNAGNINSVKYTKHEVYLSKPYIYGNFKSDGKSQKKNTLIEFIPK